MNLILEMVDNLTSLPAAILPGDETNRTVAGKVKKNPEIQERTEYHFIVLLIC